MKTTVLAFALLASSNILADEIKVLSGYLNEGRRGRIYFVAVDPAEGELSAVLPYNFFSEAQLLKMCRCMDRRDTHVIRVDQVPSRQVGVPTGMPGRTVTTHMPRFENVRCVRAPGFIEVWREIVRNSNFR